MTIPANLQQAAAPWGAEACVLCWGIEGGPYHVVDTGTPLPVTCAGSVSISGTVAVTQSGNWSVGVTGTATVAIAGTPSVSISGTPSFTEATATSGGCTPYSYISAGSSNQDSQVVKNAAGQLYGYSLFNTTASVRYVKIYDKATAPTSADMPKKRIMLPANGGANMPTTGCGIAFANGIAFRITTGPGDSDTGAAFTNDVLVNLDYA